MRVRRIGTTIGIVGALLAVPAAATAAPSTASTITIEVLFNGPETFTATGGVVCDSGTAVSDPVFGNFGGSKNRGVFNFHLTKTLTCDDGSGTFQLLVDAASTRTSPGTLGGFAAGNGTGDYEGLYGAGSLVGTGYPDGSGITDVYTGRLTIAP